MLKKFLFSESAVSEVIDFTVILGILLLSTVLIALLGIPLLNEVQKFGHIDNTEQSFNVMKENINKVVKGQSPSQSVEMKMYGDRFLIIPNSSRKSIINISLNNVSYQYELGAIEADFGDVTIAYENTGVWKKYVSEDNIMVSRPEFVIDTNNTMIIPVVTITQGNRSSASSGIGLIRVKVGEESVGLSQHKNITFVKISINSSYTDGWHKRYLNETANWNINQSFMEKKFDQPINVYILKKNITISIES